MLIQEKINAPDTLLKLYVAIDEDLKVLQPHLQARQPPRGSRGKYLACNGGRSALRSSSIAT